MTTLQTVISCIIFSGQLVVRNFPGNRCLFLHDGSYLSGNGTVLTYYNAELKPLWKKRIHNHHSFQMTKDGRFLVLTSEVHPYLGETVRFDVLNIIRADGKIERTYSYFRHISDLQAMRTLPPKDHLSSFSWDKERLPEASVEFSHANSFYEIPENPTAKKIPAFRRGNFIVNDNVLHRFFILDRHLEKILWWYAPTSDDKFAFHDVQVLSNGHLLLYNNERSETKEHYSAIQEFDPVASKVVWEYSAPKTFYSPICGGAQVLPNGNIFLSDMTNGSEAVEINSSGEQISRFRPAIYNRGSKSIHIQDAKQIDLHEFLRRNKGL